MAKGVLLEDAEAFGYGQAQAFDASYGQPRGRTLDHPDCQFFTRDTDAPPPAKAYLLEVLRDLDPYNWSRA
jgi:hypothetical protein